GLWIASLASAAAVAAIDPWVRGHPLLSGVLASLLVLASAGALAVHQVASTGARTLLGRGTAASPSSLPSPTPTRTPAPAAAPAHFVTLRPGSALPSGAQCAAWVRARPMAENKRENRGFNQV